MMTQPKNPLLRAIRPIHESLRNEKIDTFLKLVDGLPSNGTLLDVGGGPGINGEFLPLYSKFAKVVVANLLPQDLTRSADGHLEELVADGRMLPLDEGSFDWVFSNAVIEHVGGWDDQLRFAQEIRRVAYRGYFVTTPNRYFPIEPHTLLPFYQFLPVQLQRRVAPYSPGYLRQYEEIHLLSSAQMRKLFPEGEVTSIGFPLLGNSLIAYFRK